MKNAEPDSVIARDAFECEETVERHETGSSQLIQAGIVFQSSASLMAAPANDTVVTFQASMRRARQSGLHVDGK